MVTVKVAVMNRQERAGGKGQTDKKEQANTREGHPWWSA
jgi:hypothetical protein